MAYVTYTGSQHGAVPGQPAWEPGERRRMSNEAAAALTGHPLFAVEFDPAPEPPAAAPAKRSKE